MSRKFHSKRRKKRKFAGNQFTAEESQSTSTQSLGKSSKTKDGGEQLLSFQSVSEEKIESGKRRHSDIKDDESEEELSDIEEECSGLRIIETESLVSAIEQAAVCKSCKGGTLLLREDGRMGLASQMTFQCVACGEETTFSTDSKTGRFYPIYWSAVFAAKSIGRGYAALSRFCNNLDLPGPVAKRAFERHSKQIRDAAVLEAKESMSVAVEEIRQLNGCEGDELADIAINIDGTWMKRGHSSLYCAVFAISWQTDKVIDYAVLSKFCYECNYWEKQDEDL